MGLSCKDYNWNNSITKFINTSHITSNLGENRDIPVPLLICSNTLDEIKDEIGILKQNGFKYTAIYQNPFSPLQILQSGTLANDVYRKNRWMAPLVINDHKFKEKRKKSSLKLR